MGFGPVRRLQSEQLRSESRRRVEVIDFDAQVAKIAIADSHRHPMERARSEPLPGLRGCRSRLFSIDRRDVDENAQLPDLVALRFQDGDARQSNRLTVLASPS